MVFEEKPVAAGGDEEESDDEAIDMEVMLHISHITISLDFRLDQICEKISLFRILLKVENLKRTQGWWSPLLR